MPMLTGIANGAPRTIRQTTPAGQRMRYFTRELWISWQEPGYEQPPPDRDPFVLYQQELETLRPRLSPDVFRFFSEADVHDGELLDLRVIDGGRPAPLDEAGRPWATRTDWPVAVSLRVLDGWDKVVWDLRYTQVRRGAVDFPGSVNLFHDEGQGFGDWGYHELSGSPQDFFRHEVLFSSGATLLIEFKEVEVQSAPARAGGGG